MFSRSDQHHAGSPISVPGRSTTHLPSFAALSCPDRALIHRQRLESLLETALATTALLHDIEGPVMHSAHVLEVLGALNRRIAAPATPTPSPTPAPTPLPAPSPDPSLDHAESPLHVDTPIREGRASYARALSAEAAPAKSSAGQPDIIIRLDKDFSEAAERATSVHPAVILDALHGAQIPDKGLFAGVRWTRNFNLIIQVQPDTATSTFIIEKYAVRIWDRLRSTLDFPPGHPSPVFETGDSWHSVVFHNVPPLRNRSFYRLPDLQKSLETGGFLHGVKAFSVLCTDEELAHRMQKNLPVSLRITVASSDAAQQLVDHGGLLLGGRYRASHYSIRTRATPSGPDGSAPNTLPN
ncbi:hypothetical protein C8F04DRAFT_1270062 [Mycena alexandri]|uniref:Uncharacterized protein n=1 Tax=Mycena alexandri TaxID=1745969 RepID=A0AAD6SCV2_9AGAR|nr:hypothetical protein C8F04DRAFT_1270062 [Mycena alexandri]